MFFDEEIHVLDTKAPASGEGYRGDRPTDLEVALKEESTSAFDSPGDAVAIGLEGVFRGVLLWLLWVRSWSRENAIAVTSGSG